MDLTPEILLHGYSIGIFPMAENRNDPEVFWVDPRLRGVMPLDGFHMSRSLARAMRRSDWQVAINTDFLGTVDACADRSETWINAEIRSLYNALHQQGYAHSFELYEGVTLVGGVYGVTLGTAFFGESMFSRRTNASKMALAACVDHLRHSGFTLFDTQFLTEHLKSLGGVEVSREGYHKMLEKALQDQASFTTLPPPTLQDVVQRNTQTS